MIVGASAMQKEWSKPVIDSVILPAHAQTSGINGSFTATAETSTETDLLDSLVPKAHAAFTHEVKLCINVVNGVAFVEVTVEFDYWLYTGKAELDFDITLSPTKSGGGNYDIKVTGKYNEKDDTITGNVTLDSHSPRGYTATASTASCQLIPPVTSPPPTTY